MTLADGRVIRTTGDHKFLTHDGAWKRLDELVPAGRPGGDSADRETPSRTARRHRKSSAGKCSAG